MNWEGRILSTVGEACKATRENQQAKGIKNSHVVFCPNKYRSFSTFYVFRSHYLGQFMSPFSLDTKTFVLSEFTAPTTQTQMLARQ